MIWTLDDIQTANDLTPDDWVWLNQNLNFNNSRGHHTPAVCLLPWTWIIYVQRLCWTYGEDGALARLNESRRAAA